MSLVKSKQRIADHGEVFTPEWMVDAMLDLIKGEADRFDSRFLEPACGSGNFLVKILKRKLADVELKYGSSDFEKRNYALLSVMCVYGIELLPDNISECRAGLLKVFAEYLSIKEEDDLFKAACHVLSINLVQGDAITMKDSAGEPIVFAEWGYVGKGKYQRRDFSFKSLAQSSAFSAEESLFANVGKHEIFTPVRTYSSLSVSGIASGTYSQST